MYIGTGEQLWCCICVQFVEQPWCCICVQFVADGTRRTTKDSKLMLGYFMVMTVKENLVTSFVTVLFVTCPYTARVAQYIHLKLYYQRLTFLHHGT
jgi:hypothetical protein